MLQRRYAAEGVTQEYSTACQEWALCWIDYYMGWNVVHQLQIIAAQKSKLLAFISLVADAGEIRTEVAHLVGQKVCTVVYIKVLWSPIMTWAIAVPS